MNKNIMKILKGIEIVIAGFLLIGTILALFNLLCDSAIATMEKSFELQTFLEGVLAIVIGIEFIKMLILQSMESVIEVLLFAVARQVILSHDSAIENLIGVSAIALIFVIRKFLLSDIHWERIGIFQNKKD